jgi:Ca2+-binding EF-hand superfamily protein
MKARLTVVSLLICLGDLGATHTAARDQNTTPARQIRFREMDLDGDGVITRAEWRGSAQTFRRFDRNRDGVLSGEEVWVSGEEAGTEDTDLAAQFRRADRNRDGALSRREWWADDATFDRVDRNRNGMLTLSEFLGQDVEDAAPDRRSFETLDRNANGVITASEWDRSRDEFLALDEDRDGVITSREYRSLDTATESPAFRAGRERGLADGRQAGREDRTVNGGRWDLEGQRELETADAGYQPTMGARTDYQAGYRAGFRLGYRDGFGPR